MTSLWENRIRGPVLDAILKGMVVYTGTGELNPGESIGAVQHDSESICSLSEWSFPDALPNDREFEGRFLCLLHKSVDLAGRLDDQEPNQAKQSIGQPMIVPLLECIEGSQIDPSSATSRLSNAMRQPTKVIALGRNRLAHPKGGGCISEPILLEVYDEGGVRLLWTNPWLTLEDEIESRRTKKSSAQFALVTLGSAEQISIRLDDADVYARKQEEVINQFRKELGDIFQSQEEPAYVEVAANRAACLLGDLRTLQQMYPSKGHQALGNGDLGMTEFIQLAGALGLKGEDLVDTLLSEVLPNDPLKGEKGGLQGQKQQLPRPRWPPSDNTIKLDHPEGSGPLIRDLHDSAKDMLFMDLLAEPHEVGEITPTAISEAAIHTVISGPKREPNQVALEIRRHGAIFYLEGLRSALKDGRSMGAGALRAAVGIPTGSVAGWKGVSDTFLRYVLQPLEKQQILRKIGRAPRSAKYCLWTRGA